MDKSKMPDDFHKLVKDFMGDLLITFPEYKNTLPQEMMYINNNSVDSEEFSVHLQTIFDYCAGVFPERFFDILYKNELMFDKEKRGDNYNTQFYPGLDFSDLWSEDISTHTKDILWKYLQITLFSVIGNMNDELKFGDTAKLFEAIDETDLQNKIKETFETFTTMFDTSGNSSFEDFSDLSGSKGMNDFMNNLPKPEAMQDHISEMLNGKLGRLAQDIAAEASEDLDFKDEKNVGDVFEKMLKNPAKIMNLVKKIGKTIDDKIKSGDLNESELMMEANEMMNKMKNIPGMGGMEEMMNKMAGNLGGKGAKFNMNAFNQKNKMYSQKEKLVQELERRRAAKMQDDLEKNTDIKFSSFKPENAKPKKQSSINGIVNDENVVKKKRRKKKK